MNMARNEQVFSKISRMPDSKFVLHGSNRRRRLLVPKRPNYRHPNRELTRRGVYATMVIEIALLYAIIDEPHHAWSWRVERKPARLLVRVPATLHLRHGYVHLVPHTRHMRQIEKAIVYRFDAPVYTTGATRVDPTMLDYLQTKGVEFVPK